MDKENEDAGSRQSGSLEHLDSKESFRQLRWSIVVTLLGLAILAYFYF